MSNHDRIMALYRSAQAPATVACQPVGGLHARDQRVGNWQQGVKRHDVLTGRKRTPVNVKGPVGLSGANALANGRAGLTTPYDALRAGEGKGQSKAARRRARKRAGM